MRPSNRQKKAFTLIELLIVVAIIAILAAIAIPNFLEANVRAKVTRTKSDQRTLGLAMEEYMVDWNRYQSSLWLPTTARRPLIDRWKQLTTPVAYITSVPPDRMFPYPSASDPYVQSGLITNVNYHDVWTSYDDRDVGYVRETNFWGVGRTWWIITGEGPVPRSDGIYDPTNGTVSLGKIRRLSSGEVTP
jgi:prepilin-type N-terminal cleavage/methylation domain-containing protein